MNTSLITEGKHQWATLVLALGMGDRLSALLVSLMAFAARASRPKPLSVLLYFFISCFY